RVGLLLRHASQNSLDESSQRNPSNLPEDDDFKPPFKNPEHFAKAFATLDTLRKTRVMCDVVLVAGDVEIPAHRMVLASCSPYFYAMFTSFEEKGKDKVHIQSVDQTALQMLIGYGKNLTFLLAWIILNVNYRTESIKSKLVTF
ncbi:unnamed protein product, partial [Allacma fusca]